MGCAHAQPAIEEVALPLTAAEAVFWDQSPIPVCWENASSSNIRERVWVMEALSDTWEDAARIRFGVWDACDEDSDGIRVLFDARSPHVKALGNGLDGVRNGLVLNNDVDSLAQFGCSTKCEFCIRVQAVHEFGHALGFTHEQNRSDTPSQCQELELEQGTEGGLLITDWDLRSVMNYCHTNFGMYGNRGDEMLSPADRYGARKAYGGGDRFSQNPGDRFGSAFAVGDFNNDRVDDLVVGIPFGWPGVFFRSGDVRVFHGSRRGGLTTGSESFMVPRRDGEFGSALATGDFNGDGIDDLAVSAPASSEASDAESGYVHVFIGTGHGLDWWQGVHQGGLGLNEDGDRFGHALSAGDFDGNGFDDLAVGAPGEKPGDDPRSGYVFVFAGSASGLTPWQGLDQIPVLENLGGDEFGAALAAGDFNGDGHDDLAVGAPGKGVRGRDDVGALVVFTGSRAGLQPRAVPDRVDASTLAAGGRFGHSLASGDLDGDGREDLAVGAPGEAAGELPASGVVHVYRGSSSLLVTPMARLTQRELSEHAAGEGFGTALAFGDLDANGLSDLFVGAPGDRSGRSDSGSVFAFKGYASPQPGLFPWQRITQRGLWTNEAGDEFGSAIAVGRFQWSGRCESLVVGAPGEAPYDSEQTGYAFAFGIPDFLAMRRPDLEARSDLIAPVRVQVDDLLVHQELSAPEVNSGSGDAPGSCGSSLPAIRPWYGVGSF